MYVILCFICIISLCCIIFHKNIELLESPYDLIISINVHEKFDFLLKQLDNISKHVRCNYAVILNCNDYMFNECKSKKLPKNVYIHPVVLNKKRFHGSLCEGVYNNMTYAINFKFDYFLVTSSRNMFENELTLDDLKKVIEIHKNYENNNLKNWEDKKDDWHWPSIKDTQFLNYMLKNNKKLYQSPHEGLLFTYAGCMKIIEFLKNQSEIKGELFQLENTPPEEYALQTIVESENEHFYYIGNGVENEKHGPNDPNSDVLKFMYKVNREDFVNYMKYIFII